MTKTSPDNRLPYVIYVTKEKYGDDGFLILSKYSDSFKNATKYVRFDVYQSSVNKKKRAVDFLRSLKPDTAWLKFTDLYDMYLSVGGSAHIDSFRGSLHYLISTKEYRSKKDDLGEDSRLSLYTPVDKTPERTIHDILRKYASCN